MPPKLDVTSDNNGGLTFYAIQKYHFKNYGLKSGFIDKIEIKPIGLGITPQVEVIFIDKEALHWREEKEIKCEYLLKLNKIQLYEMNKKLSNSSKTSAEFRTFIYDNSGKNIYSGSFWLYGSQESSHKTNNN